MNVQPFANLKQGKESLMKALQDNLQERGVISNLEAILRAEMFAALEQKYDSLPMPDSDTRLINELVREYLMFNGYGHSLSVFEAGNVENYW
jgi:lisH domain-containing protein FOPNL